MSEHKNKIKEGPPSYENWIAYKNGVETHFIEEYYLYTDAGIIGQAKEGFGPYQFINTVPCVKDRIKVAPYICLRIKWYKEQQKIPDFSETNEGYYHGGNAVDEIAALCSLLLGARIKAGAIRRIFNDPDDPYGNPVNWYFGEEPSIYFGIGGPIIPNARGPKKLTDLELMKKYPNLESSDAIALIRASRLYQNSLWLSESEPSLSWLMMVSALETIADQFDRSKYEPIKILEIAKPKLYKKIEESGDKELKEIVLSEVAESIRATKKLLEFVFAYFQPPPEKRPTEVYQIDWKQSSLKKILSKIYNHRSKALHGGVPFPAPMSYFPYYQDNGAIAEKPPGGGTSSMGGVWLPKDIPMLLNTFEYITRKCIIAWMSQLSEKHL